MRALLLLAIGCGTSGPDVVASDSCAHIRATMDEADLTSAGDSKGQFLTVRAEGGCNSISWIDNSHCPGIEIGEAVVCVDPPADTLCVCYGYCTSVAPNVDVMTIETYNGEMGLSVVVDGDQISGDCEFRKVTP